MRKRIVAGNWKMHLELNESLDLINSIETASVDANSRIIVAPSFTNLHPVIQLVTANGLSVEVAAQNMSHEKEGAFTGEVSGSMLKSLGINIVIVGHSERRTYFNENDDVLVQKLQFALDLGFEVIFCFGEHLVDRKKSTHFYTIESHLTRILSSLDHSDLSRSNIILAYEPVWAIGTGKTASPSQVQEVHAFVRNFLSKNFGNEIADTTSILYGGSIKPNNAGELFEQVDVDGGLVGGASLVAKSFNSIIDAIN